MLEIISSSDKIGRFGIYLLLNESHSDNGVIGKCTTLVFEFGVNGNGMFKNVHLLVLKESSKDKLGALK